MPPTSHRWAGERAARATCLYASLRYTSWLHHRQPAIDPDRAVRSKLAERLASSQQGGQRRAELAYEVIKRRLLRGEWKSGERIGIEGLKTELKVSKQPVMDALRRLSAEGLVEIIPQVGCQVPVHDYTETVDFFQMFASLEAESTAVAALRRTDGQLNELVAINEKIAASQYRDGSADLAYHYLEINRQFHELLVEMAQSPILLRVSSLMWDMCDLVINSSFGPAPLASEVHERYQDHQRIIEALRASDPPTAREEMRAHILRNIPMLERAQQGDDSGLPTGDLDVTEIDR